MKKTGLSVLMVMLFFLFSAIRAHAAILHVEWCPVAGSTGYKVHYGSASRAYENSWENGDSTVWESNPLAEGVYFVAVSSYDASSVEGPLSEEKIAVLVENGDSAAGWSVVKGVAPVAGYDAENTLFFSGVTNSTAIASSKISLANVPAAASYFVFKFKATGYGGYVSVVLTTKSKGTVTLLYKLQDTNSLGSTTAVLGLGAALKDGQWHSIEREIANDLVTAGISTAADDIASFNAMYVYSYYNRSMELSKVGFSQNPNGTCQ